MQTLSQASTLPESAKYQLFQHVQFTERSKHLQGIITGLEYLHPAVAESDGSEDQGYLYAIRRELDDPVLWWIPEGDILSVRAQP